MLDALEAYSRDGMDLGAMGAAMGGNRGRKTAERAEAIRKAGTVSGPEDLKAKVRGVAEEFTAIFMNQVMKSMRKTVQQNPAMHGDNGEKFFQEMLDAEQSKSLAKGSGYGLTDLVYQALIANVEVRQPDADAGGGAETGQELQAEPVGA